MPVREDILNFMRSLKAGKQAVKESEWKQGAYEEASDAHQKSLEQYAQQLTAFEIDLADYEQRVDAWERDSAAKQQAYDTASKSFPATKKKFDDTLATYTSMYGDPSTWDQITSNNFKIASGGFTFNSPPQPPSLPTFLPQPAGLEAQHPGPTPSFEFVLPETPYTAALVKSSSLNAMPSSTSSGERNYYQAIQDQASRPKWWEQMR